MKAIALPAADSTHPALNALTSTTVPAASDSPAAACAPSVTLARAPSEARSRTQTVPALPASTETTVSMAPADRSIEAAATETATGITDTQHALEGLVRAWA